MDDWQQILEQLLRRDPQGLRSLMDCSVNQVYRLVSTILGRMGTPEDVEEVVGDIYVKAWEQVEDYDARRSTLKSWLLMLAKYSALDRHRQLCRDRLTPDGQPRVVHLHEGTPAPLTEPPDDHCEDSALLQAALKHLHPTDREIITRRFFLEQSVAEIAAAIDLTQAAVHNRLWRAKRNLRNVMTRTEGVHERAGTDT